MEKNALDALQEFAQLSGVPQFARLIIEAGNGQDWARERVAGVVDQIRKIMAATDSKAPNGTAARGGEIKAALPFGIGGGR